MSCEDDTNCGFVVEYDPAGVILHPALDPSTENGLVCRTGGSPGLWDPDEKVAVFCADIHGYIEGTFTNTSAVYLPIFVGLTATNPSPTLPAYVHWAWYNEETRIAPQPGVRGTIVTMSGVFPSLVDQGYMMWTNPWSVDAALTVPGSGQSFGDCPTPLAPGASATRVWAYRFEGAGNPGTWRGAINRLHASALVVVVP